MDQNGFPNSAGGSRIGSSAFQVGGILYLPIANYGTVFAAKWSCNGGLEAVVSKWLAQGHKGLITLYDFNFLRYILSYDHTTKLEMKNLLKTKQWWVGRDSNLIPAQYRLNAITTTPCSPIRYTPPRITNTQEFQWLKCWITGVCLNKNAIDTLVLFLGN